MSRLRAAVAPLRWLGVVLAPLRRPVFVRVVLLALFLVAAARIVSPETFHLRSGDLIVDITPSVPGGTLVLNLGPFGELAWSTHKAPLDIEATFVVRRDVSAPPGLAEFRDLRWTLLLHKLPWLLAAGALAAGLLVSDPRRPSIRAILLGASGMTAFAAAVVGASILTFDASAFANPRYRGPIDDAPRVLRLLREARRDLSGVSRNINSAVTGLQRIHGQIVSRTPQPPSDTTRLLVISDVHNNPLGLLVAKELAGRFQVDAVLDAGDFTDRGSEPEAELFARFGDLGLPHVLVGGNHEDSGVLRRAARVRGVTLLESTGRDVAEVGGITIVGDSDPNAYSIDSDPRNELAVREMPGRCSRLAERVLDVRPEVLLVHDPEQGECAARLAQDTELPLVFVWGHTHRPAYVERGSVIGVSAGTSGANGIKSARKSAYGFALLEFDRTTLVPVSVCLFAFDRPAALRQATCHMAPGRGEETVSGG